MFSLFSDWHWSHSLLFPPLYAYSAPLKAVWQHGRQGRLHESGMFPHIPFHFVEHAAFWQCINRFYIWVQAGDEKTNPLRFVLPETEAKRWMCLLWEEFCAKSGFVTRTRWRNGLQEKNLRAVSPLWVLISNRLKRPPQIPPVQVTNSTLTSYSIKNRGRKKWTCMKQCVFRQVQRTLKNDQINFTRMLKVWKGGQ